MIQGLKYNVNQPIYQVQNFFRFPFCSHIYPWFLIFQKKGPIYQNITKYKISSDFLSVHIFIPGFLFSRKKVLFIRTLPSTKFLQISFLFTYLSLVSYFPEKRSYLSEHYQVQNFFRFPFCSHIYPWFLIFQKKGPIYQKITKYKISSDFLSVHIFIPGFLFSRKKVLFIRTLPSTKFLQISFLFTYLSLVSYFPEKRSYLSEHYQVQNFFRFPFCSHIYPWFLIFQKKGPIYQNITKYKISSDFLSVHIFIPGFLFSRKKVLFIRTLPSTKFLQISFLFTYLSLVSYFPEKRSYLSEHYQVQNFFRFPFCSHIYPWFLIFQKKGPIYQNITKYKISSDFLSVHIFIPGFLFSRKKVLFIRT